MSTINQTCQAITEKVDEGLGCALVDVDSGLLLGVHNKATYLSESYLDAVAAAAVEMFRGKTVRVVEDLIAQQRKVEPQRLITEVQMTTERTYHFMAILPEKKNMLAVLITGKRTNLGMGWATLRTALPELAKLCP
jgi:hypothetical protein